MAFFLKLVVFIVWGVIMATLIIGSTQGSSPLRRRPYTDKMKSVGDKEGNRYFFARRAGQAIVQPAAGFVDFPRCGFNNGFYFDRARHAL